MFRTLRALFVAAIVVVSLLGSAAVASADPGPTAPQPTNVFDITCE
jgi:hypothetical protein